MNKYEDLELCKKCGGGCCKRMGCHFSPDDFAEITYESLKSKIDEGNISIDWWEGDPTGNDKLSRAYFLRVRNKFAPIVDPSFGGICSLLTNDGCPLPFEKRPKGGRMLIPSETGCVLEYSKQQVAIDWLEYTDILQRLYDEYIDTEVDEEYLNMILNLFKKD
ncbi:hypothetical protein [Clostridium sp.]|uniref:hypothetical protein n=1 Tax=Clostridium sp. TaxID=1506 RepID=UPI001B5FC43D|nr:hypothetical protein [Clostridium sp.]MBP3917306.1 hypothetical protein [Clostridium sp.]